MNGKSDQQRSKENTAQDKWSIGRPNVFNSIWGLILIPPVFGYLVFAKLEIPLWARLALLTVIWWGGLFVFWVFPIFSYFDAEKRWIARLNASSAVPAIKIIVSAVFYSLYWPIYIPKEKVFWTLFAVVCAYYVYKFFGG